MWNLKKKWKDINACCFSTIPVKVCAKLKFWILKIALALKISKISSGKLCWAEQKKKKFILVIFVEMKKLGIFESILEVF